MLPTDRRYTKDHEWVKIEGDVAIIGLTDYAQEQLGDIVYVELPNEGDMADAGGRLAVVESVKAASDVFSPVSGEVVEINMSLEDAPENVNEAPWDTWFAKIGFTAIDEQAQLDAQGYQALLNAEGQA